ncbi:MAG: FAD-dependent oxidoreductase [Lachnospiraceae bacterium]|nr:FAD-dependent oxidoreductase [Lachnospiraceae bacterium]
MYDLIIIGSGPAGLAAAIYGIRGGLKLLVLESNAMSGGQVLKTYEVDNYPGMPAMDGFEMGNAFKKHADRLGVEFKTAKVISVEDKGDRKVIRTKNEELEAHTVILAMGADHARLGVSGEEELTGRGVSYCATCDGAFFRGRRAAVVGGGDAALEDAVYLSKICSEVFLIHRRDELRGAHILQKELAGCNNVSVLYSTTVERINGTDMVGGLTLNNLRTGQQYELEISAVFIAVGIVPCSEAVKELPILDEGGYVTAGEDGATVLPGLFVAGDLRRKPLRQIVTAAADGANAAYSAIAYCNKEKKRNN